MFLTKCRAVDGVNASITLSNDNYIALLYPIISGIDKCISTCPMVIITVGHLCQILATLPPISLFDLRSEKVGFVLWFSPVHVKNNIALLPGDRWGHCATAVHKLQCWLID